MEQQKWQAGLPNKTVIVPQIEPLPFQVREAVNILRGNIQLSGYDVKTIAVTSALANEGKSSLAFRLAKSMAGLNKRTLFLDCDIRNSKVMSRYDIQEQTTGLTEYLCGRAALYDIIYRTDDKWLDMIFTGAVAPNPSELISGQLFNRMMEWLREHYDYVIVDTPPVNVVIDGVLISKQCDGTVLVLESGRTERAQAVRAREQLEFGGIRILGAVLNKMETGQGRYGYGRKYGYGYGYGYGYDESSSSVSRKSRKVKEKEQPEAH